MRAQEAGACFRGTAGNRIERSRAVIDAGQQGRAQNAGRQTGCAQFLHGPEAQIGPGRARLQLARQRRIRGGDRHVQHQGVAFGDLGQQVDVARDQAGLGDDAQPMPLTPGKYLQQAARDAHPPFDRLVGIGGGAQGNLVAWVDFAEFLIEQPRRILLQVYLPLEGHSPTLRGSVIGAGGHNRDRPGLQELVRVTGVAVAAAELAAAIRVDRVGQRELAPRDGLVQDGPRCHGPELHLVPGVRVGGFGGQARQSGGWADAENRKQGSGRVHFRHVFASREPDYLRRQGTVKGIQGSILKGKSRLHESRNAMTGFINIPGGKLSKAPMASGVGAQARSATGTSMYRAADPIRTRDDASEPFCSGNARKKQHAEDRNSPQLR